MPMQSINHNCCCMKMYTRCCIDFDLFTSVACRKTYPEVINEQLPDRVRCISYVNYLCCNCHCNSGFLVMDEIQEITNGLHCSFKPRGHRIIFMRTTTLISQKHSSMKKLTHFSEWKWPNHHKLLSLNLVHGDHFCMRPANARRRCNGGSHRVNKMQRLYLL